MCPHPWCCPHYFPSYTWDEDRIPKIWDLHPFLLSRWTMPKNSQKSSDTHFNVYLQSLTLSFFRNVYKNRSFLNNIVSFLNKMGPFLKKIGCFFHVKRRKKPPIGRLFRDLLLCWCKYNTSEGEIQMLINFRSDFVACQGCGKLPVFHSRNLNFGHHGNAVGAFSKNPVFPRKICRARK